MKRLVRSSKPSRICGGQVDVQLYLSRTCVPLLYERGLLVEQGGRAWLPHDITRSHPGGSPTDAITARDAARSLPRDMFTFSERHVKAFASESKINRQSRQKVQILSFTVI